MCTREQGRTSKRLGPKLLRNWWVGTCWFEISCSLVAFIGSENWLCNLRGGGVPHHVSHFWCVQHQIVWYVTRWGPKVCTDHTPPPPHTHTSLPIPSSPRCIINKSCLKWVILSYLLGVNLSLSFCSINRMKLWWTSKKPSKCTSKSNRN